MKRHTSQTIKQKNGQYFTTNVNEILSGYEDVIKGKLFVEPFAGGGDLVRWGIDCGGRLSSSYDLHPQSPDIIENDSLLNPPDYKNKFVLSNPPYLSSNKNKDKAVYKKWGQSDLYKCHLASISSCTESIQILPSNFFCESRSKIRDKLFNTHHIISAKYWSSPVFENATTGICVIHLKKGHKTSQRFPINKDGEVFEMILEKGDGYLYGADFFDYINITAETILKTDVGMAPPNTNIILSLLDKGKYKSGLHYNEEQPLYCQPKSFTTYQLTIPYLTLTEIQQRTAVDMFNNKMSYYREKYHSMFLANYMGDDQKILSRNYCHKLLSKVLLSFSL